MNTTTTPMSDSTNRSSNASTDYKRVMQQTLMSFKKEVWEYKTTLLWLPLVLGSVLLIALVFEAMLLNDYQTNRIMELMTAINDGKAEQFISQGSFMFTHALFGVFLLSGFFVQLRYFISCLFDERRDLSIYFWRSMPVSDTLVIGVKFFTGAIVIPLVFLFAALITMIIGLVVLSIFALLLGLNVDGSLWTLLGNLDISTAVFSMFLGVIPAMLWLFPIYAWLMLASIFASKAPFLWASLPIVILALVETLLLSTGIRNSPILIDVITSYLGFDATDSIIFGMQAEAMNISGLFYAQAMLAKVSIGGLVVGSLFLFATYWLRVNRSHG